MAIRLQDDWESRCPTPAAQSPIQQGVYCPHQQVVESTRSIPFHPDPPRVVLDEKLDDLASPAS